jgi:hypothetical protein
MRIRMKDGRVFQGTALQIVRAMQDVAFGVDAFTVPEYIDWVAKNAGDFEGEALDVTGGTDEQKADSLVRELLRVGLAQKA